MQKLAVTLAGGMDAPTRARNAVASLTGLGTIGENLPLLVTELVTNSVLHAGADSTNAIELKVYASPTGARVEVEDSGPGFEARPRVPDYNGGGGFGLLLVDRLADRWGVEPDCPSRVWFEIDGR
jgi:anti-sigma regulatory factor (Ser/Thr protein kinase)